MIRNQVEKIKALIKDKFKITEIPNNGDECVAVREQIVEGKSYIAEVAIGKVTRFPTFFNIVGLVFQEEYNKFTEATLKIESKYRQKSIYILCGIAKDGFIRTVDETTKFGLEPINLSSFTEILEKVEK